MIQNLPSGAVVPGPGAYRDISPETLTALLRLDPETGQLYWRERGLEWFRDGAHSALHSCKKWNAKFAGKRALTARSADGRAHGVILRRKCYAYRVIFAMTQGRWPDGEIDHIDNDPSNDRPENLREATHRENQRNRRSFSGTSQFKGVSWQRAAKKWQASIADETGQTRHLGFFIDERAAAEAYDKAARVHHGRFARPNEYGDVL